LNNRVLICPLDWGLGHASRIIPIALYLKQKGVEVFIVTSGNSFIFLKSELPDCIHINLPSFSPQYPKKSLRFVHFAFWIPKLLYYSIKEYFATKKLVQRLQPSIIISDNRYGMRSKKCKSILITHQIFIKLPKSFSFLETYVHSLSHLIFRKFDECWIPDYENTLNYTGELSHLKYLNPNRYKYIGILSRFQDTSKTVLIPKPEFDILILLSGQEPARTILEKILLEQFKQSKYKVLIVRGKPNKRDDIGNQIYPNIIINNCLYGQALLEAIQKSKLIICRSGYSSIMDLISLNKKAILIPTPGQSEQEYLAEYLGKYPNFAHATQQHLQIERYVLEAFSKEEQPLYNQAIYKKILDKMLKDM